MCRNQSSIFCVAVVSRFVFCRLFSDVQLQQSEKLQIKVRGSVWQHFCQLGSLFCFCFVFIRGNVLKERLASFPKTLLLQVPSRLKEALKTAKESLERRLQEEQRLVRHASRLLLELIFDFSGFQTAEQLDWRRLGHDPTSTEAFQIRATQYWFGQEL